MKLILSLVMLITAPALAASNLEGAWQVRNKTFQFIEFEGRLTLNTRSYYSNGAPSDYFFEFQVPQQRDVQPGEILQGRLRSLDGYYGCVFDEPAQAQLEHDGRLKLHYPLLTFHRETRSVRETDYGYRRIVEWDGWRWVETIYHFPIERWRVISSECVIDQRNWVTESLSRSLNP